MRWIAILVSVMLAACSSSTTTSSFTSSENRELGEQLSQSKQVGISPLEIPPLPWDMDSYLPTAPKSTPVAPTLLAVSPEMKAFVDSIDPSMSPRQRMYRILYLLRLERFHLEYDLDTTATAAEAFAQKRGNCISFAAMIVAFAREVGIPAHFNRVHAPQGRRATRSISGSVLVENILHINAEVSLGWSSEIIEMNFAPQSRYRHERISDEEVQSLFLNNLALNKARDGEQHIAFNLLREALGLTPKSSIVWNSIGYLYRRQGKLDLAEMSYTRAIYLDSKNNSAKNNLQRVYQLQNRLELLQAAGSPQNSDQDS
ncbi:hypothetical protein KUV95_01035 [Microbulbifer agarilyticus]|uniref:transglutaminase domain-containing protein n=1 Tax=Microbulbifer agarilyticus TaxID=260552 RepID=UPI001C98D799|nr:transglutaminase domain-containing protein [Microbulbifer agarilyticus]MBY6210127.1 hypothetical protein [Microbulbifer agarilyticus]